MTIRRSVRCLSVFFLLLSLGQSAFAQKVVSWNLEWFPGKKPDPSDPAVAVEQMAAAQAELQKLQPDIFIGLELRSRAAFDQLVSVVTGLHVAVVSAFRDEEGAIAKQQVGIASRYPIHAAWSESWVPTMDRLPRGFSIALIREPKSGKLLTVYGVHLKSNRAISEKEALVNVAMRNESAHQLAHDYDELRRLVVKDEESLGWIIAGDFNTNHDDQFPGDQTISILEKAGFHNSWAGVPPEERKTWQGEGKFAGTTFDYIMTRDLGATKTSLGSVAEGISDHLPVILKLGASAP